MIELTRSLARPACFCSTLAKGPCRLSLSAIENISKLTSSRAEAHFSNTARRELQLTKSGKPD